LQETVYYSADLMHSRRVPQHLFPATALFHYPGLKKDEIGYQDIVNVSNQYCTLWRLARNYLSSVVISLATPSGWKGWKERERKRDNIAGYVPLSSLCWCRVPVAWV